MQNKFERVLRGIKQKTGLDIDVYDIFGKLVCSTAAQGANFNFRHVKDFSEGVSSDKLNNLTYFTVSLAKEPYIGIISGSDLVSRNYAYMVSALMELGASATDAHLSKNDALKAILLGDFDAAEIGRFIQNYSAPEGACFVTLIEAQPQEVGEIFSFLTNFSDNSQDTPVVVADNQVAYVKFVSADDVFLSAVEFAELLSGSIEMELNFSDVNIGTGPVAKSLYEIASVFAECQTAIRIGMQINRKSKVHSYKEYILMKMIDDIDVDTLKGYLRVLLDAGAREILSDDDMMSTAEEFLNNSLNISETARILYMHRNTLMYRLDKIERSMGLNIRKFTDAVTFRIVMLLYNKIKG